MVSLSTGDYWNLGRIAEIAERCGVSPNVADVLVEFPENDNDSAYCHLQGVDGGASNENEEKKVNQVWSLLGLDDTGYRKIEFPHELDEIIDRALSLAPRIRSR